MELKNFSGGIYDIQGYPSNCPFCHRTIRPLLVYPLHNAETGFLEVFMKCPHERCCESFIGYYHSSYNSDTYYYQDKVSKGNIIEISVSEHIDSISPMFTKIYKQADIAEKEGLVDICGVGYRKALEFLIKDYAIINHPSEKEKIENKLLGACIKDYISDVNINSVAKRAAWLGNDETHYRRIWQGKTLTDLKNLIKLTMHWMEMEKLTREYESDMPN